MMVSLLSIKTINSFGYNIPFQLPGQKSIRWSIAQKMYNLDYMVIE